MSITLPVIEGMGPVIAIMAFFGVVILIKFAIGIFL